MKNVRIIYKKRGGMRFASHLDMNRYMSRLLKRADLPIWFTEGFNPHLYITFALPLPLGVESDYEVLDTRVTYDELPLSDIKNSLCRAATDGIEIVEVAEPVKKPAEIAYAAYTVTFDRDVSRQLKSFLASGSITVKKKNKKGVWSEVDLVPMIKKTEVNKFPSGCELRLIAKAGGNGNLNPSLLLDAFFKFVGEEVGHDILRSAIYDKDMNIFK